MKLDMTFIGEFTNYAVASGNSKPRLHLDGAASPLAAQLAIETINKLLPHYSNSHSYIHNSAKITTKAFNWAHDTVLESLSADINDYTAIFMGSGTTSPSNRLARGLANARPGKEIIMVSSMEHHANDLPHRQTNNKVIHLPLTTSNKATDQGAVDLIEFETLCKKHSQNINYIAVSSVSNVTGICNPVKDIARIAHQHGALILVDAAQSVAHMPSEISENDIDFMMFSGHKIYTPMAPGVLVGKRDILALLSGQDLGGGSVADVSLHDYTLFDRFPDREQSGTPNIVGAVALARVLKELTLIGFDKILNHSTQLTKQLIDGLTRLDGINVYGDKSLARVGAVSFNHKYIDHGLLAAILNDYFAIAVRNECFCAHPYVSSLLKEELWELDIDNVAEEDEEAYINRKRGMVRASISLYTNTDDVVRFLSAIKKIINDIEFYRSHYNVDNDGLYHHNTFILDWQSQLDF